MSIISEHTTELLIGALSFVLSGGLMWLLGFHIKKRSAETKVTVEEARAIAEVFAINQKMVVDMQRFNSELSERARIYQAESLRHRENIMQVITKCDCPDTEELRKIIQEYGS